MIYQVSIPSNSKVFGDRVLTVEIDVEKNRVKLSGRFSNIDESEQTIFISAETLRVIMPFLYNAQGMLHTSETPNYKSKELKVSETPEPPCMRDDWQNDPVEFPDEDLFFIMFTGR